VRFDDGTRASTFDTVVRSADPSRWDDPSPCEGWTARDVVNHMIMMADMVAGMATGKPAVVDEPEGYPAPGVPDRVFRSELLDAVSDDAALLAETMSPWGHTTTIDFLPMAGGDAVVHTLDLAVALEQEAVIDPELAEAAMRAWADAEASGSPLRQAAILGDLVVSDTTDPLAQLLAFTGRRAGVHARIARLHVPGEPGKLGFDLGECHLHVEVGRQHCRVGRHGEQPEAESPEPQTTAVTPAPGQEALDDATRWPSRGADGARITSSEPHPRQNPAPSRFDSLQTAHSTLEP
jgi:uncharacterized protein (TIGR03086 family)